jgi:hypothetical protein
VSLAYLSSGAHEPAPFDPEQARWLRGLRALGSTDRRLLLAVARQVLLLNEEEGEDAACALLDRLICLFHQARVSSAAPSGASDWP